MKRWVWTLPLFLSLSFLIVLHVALPGRETDASSQLLKVDTPGVILTGTPFSLTVTVLDADGNVDRARKGVLELAGVSVMGKEEHVPSVTGKTLVAGQVTFRNLMLTRSGKHQIQIVLDSVREVKTLRVIPGFLSLLPPLFSIILALTIRQVIIALFLGLWLGSSIFWGYDPLLGLIHALDAYCLKALTDPDHGAIILFTLILGGMVGVISRSGGTRGIVEKLTTYTNHPRGAQMAGWGLGMLIFFDDYANTLIVGNTMRPFTDRLRISREKLSYIVDSTAAPVVSLFPVSTWVGYQIGLLDDTFKQHGIQEDAYLFFLRSIPYASYSLFTIFFVFLVALTLRDFGPMLKSEKRSFGSGKVMRNGAEPLARTASPEVEPPGDIPYRWYNALIPIFTVLATSMGGLYWSGRMNLAPERAGEGLKAVIGAADSFHVLMWAAFAGALIAILLAVGQRLLSLRRAMEAWVAGVKSMVLAIIILVLAWGMGHICADLHTADYVIQITDGILSPHLLPLIIFITAAFISFSTGTSWATMAILVPIVVPISFRLCMESGLSPAVSSSIMLGSVGAILSGSVFGDHTSPISDTTILSSMASGSDHIDHVRTQLPYASLTALVAIIAGYLPAGFGWNIYVSFGAGLLLLVTVLFLAGKKARSFTS